MKHFLALWAAVLITGIAAFVTVAALVGGILLLFGVNERYGLVVSVPFGGMLISFVFTVYIWLTER